MAGRVARLVLTGMVGLSVALTCHTATAALQVWGEAISSDGQNGSLLHNLSPGRYLPRLNWLHNLLFRQLICLLPEITERRTPLI